MLPTKAPAVDSAAVRQLKIAYLETPLAPKPDPLYANQRDLFLRKAARNAQGNAEGNAKGNDDDDPGLGLGGGGSSRGEGYSTSPLLRGGRRTRTSCRPTLTPAASSGRNNRRCGTLPSCPCSRSGSTKRSAPDEPYQHGCSAG